MLDTRSPISVTYQTTPEQYQRALDYVTGLLGTGYFYGIEAICTTFVSDIYNMTRMPGTPAEWGSLFTPAQIEAIREAMLVDLAIPGLNRQSLDETYYGLSDRISDFYGIGDYAGNSGPFGDGNWGTTPAEYGNWGGGSGLYDGHYDYYAGSGPWDGPGGYRGGGNDGFDSGVDGWGGGNYGGNGGWDHEGGNWGGNSGDNGYDGHYGYYAGSGPNDGPGGYYMPILIDLDGDGVELAPRDENFTLFDFDDDGYAERTAWVGADDGLLMFDENGDGAITSAREIAFAQWLERDGVTDLEALAEVFDTNGDGVLDALDADWASFGIWQDINSDGVLDAGEFKSLAEWGITAIGLSYSQATTVVLSDGSVISGFIDVTATGADGSEETWLGADVAFSTDALGVAVAEDDAGVTTYAFENGATEHAYAFAEDAAASDIFLGSDDADAPLAASLGDGTPLDGLDIVAVTGNSAGNVIDGSGRTAALTLDGGGGDDELAGGSANDLLLGGDGDDELVAGGGSNNLLDGGDGDDELEAGFGGYNQLYGGDGDDYLKGGFRDNNRLDGGAGDDILDGGYGSDTFVFKPDFGRDTIVDFSSDDVIEFDNSLFADFAAVLAAASETNGDTVITLDDHNHITLSNVALSSLSADDFRFVA